MAQLWTRDECEEELAWIKNQSPNTPSAKFAGDPKCFKRYCKHQATTFTRSGFPELATQALEHGFPELKS